MSANFWIEEDVCALCGGPVDVFVRQGFARGGRPLPAIAETATCRRGCAGQVLAPARMTNRRVSR
jgi:hypothetical protein